MLENRQLDRSIPIPLYYQLKNIILEEIENGAYPIDSLIPTENDLTDIFQVSRTTVRQAILELAQEGKLYRIKSKGTFVAKPKIVQKFMTTLQSYNTEIENSGKVPSTEVLALEAVPMPESLIKLFNSDGNAKAIYLYRVRKADGDPIVRVKTYLPYDSCSFLEDYDFTKESLYNALSSHESTRICRVTRTCEAIATEQDDVKYLNVRRGAPIHFFTTIGYNAKGMALEFSQAYYRGDKNSFTVEIAVE